MVWRGFGKISAGLMAVALHSPPVAAAQDTPVTAGAPVRQVAQAQAPQPGAEYRDRWAFGFMSPGYTNDPRNTAIWHLGGGYEWLVAGTFAVSAGAGMMVAAVEGADWGFPVSANGSYYFREAPAAQRALVPFVSAGYTRGGFTQSSNMFNIGAGFNQWTQVRSGFRFEVRHHISRERGPNGRNWFVDFRLGFVV